MADRPAADVDVSVDLVRALLRDQHPDLADLSLRVVASGWDNVVLRLGDRLAVRVPRRPEAVPLVLHEQRWLPELARRLDVATPVPGPGRRPVGPARAPVERRAVVPRDARLGSPARAARAGGRAARPVSPPRCTCPRRRAPRPTPCGASRCTRDTAVRERLATGLVPRADEVTPLWAAAVAAPPWSRPASWVHGDLHPANLLVTPQHDLAAVLDFGDLTAGDPATDLATAWLTFTAPGRAELRGLLDATGRYDDATWVRARGWALCMATALLVTSDDDAHLAAIGAHALHEALDDPA
ncbi:phosphotransferase [Cellulomonas cellasea]|uniref:Aminoglycoside phosphotransferase (APT) family kinase protein n=1 Tax=Cellulomonas cellasea TaxID=43670 RepID=A0A7W4UD64_9CELL|nr:phosphotransferase [Cellulomonas cellasea]MBB2922021.1 aminoglycoside phosphotransferase (APT) family kinase protein [Cellulomonas cellasea]